MIGIDCDNLVLIGVVEKYPSIFLLNTLYFNCANTAIIVNRYKAAHFYANPFIAYSIRFFTN